MRAFIRMWNKPDVEVECKELIVKDGSKVEIDGEETQMLIVVAADGIYHSVIDVEVL